MTKCYEPIRPIYGEWKTVESYHQMFGDWIVFSGWVYWPSYSYWVVPGTMND